MNLSKKIFEKDFVGSNTKNAYLKACKWVAQKIIGKVEVGETLWSIEKVEASLPTFKLELHIMLDAKKTEKSFCERCKEMHKSFFINENYNCNRCNMKAFNKELDLKLKIKEGHRKNQLQ